MTDILDAGERNSWEGGASFSMRHRLLRLMWMLTWRLLASWTPVQFLGWRRMLLRLFGASVGRGAVVHPSARIWYPANLELADFACIGPRVEVYCMAKVSLGHHAITSQGAHLCAGTHDIEDPDFQLIARPIAIGARAWIAAEAFVGPGVRIGEGAVLGARAVTFRDLAPWTVHAGNPAKPIKPRRVRFEG
jgi:putative colanic acid biosynthesis acetyltransferase WcaF